MNKTVKKLVVVGLVLVIGFFIYRTFAPKEPPAAAPQAKNGLTVVDPTSTAVKKENIDKLLNVLLSINTIRLSDALFTRNDFTSLKDFSISEEEQKLDDATGRNNPFLPIGDEPLGQVGGTTQGTTTTTATTVTPTIKTNPVTTMTLASALLVGENTYSDSLEQYFEWGNVPNPPFGNKTPVVAKVGKTTYTYSLTGLTPDTTYYYQAVVKTKNGAIVPGTVQSFKTPKL